MGEGVLFFNGSAAGGVQAAEHITEITDDAGLRKFIDAQSDHVRVGVFDIRAARRGEEGSGSRGLCSPAAPARPGPRRGAARPSRHAAPPHTATLHASNPPKPPLPSIPPPIPNQVLTVVDISLSDAAPCIHIYPAVLALARSFQGYAAFGRVVADQSDAARELLRTHAVVEVPTFLFFKNGREVDRCARGCGARRRRARRRAGLARVV